MVSETPPSDLSSSQVGAFLCFIGTFALCAYSRFLKHGRAAATAAKDADQHDDEAAYLETNGAPQMPSKHTNGHAPAQAPSDPSDALTATTSDQIAEKGGAGLVNSLLTSPFVRVLKLEESALVQHSETLDAAAEFCAWMVYYYLADRTTLIPYAAKSYSRDIVATVYAAMVLVAFAGSLRKEKRVMTLSRQQTEEWKGWMQVMFLLYHYFEAREAYNLVRVLISGYVWMTGYGNFHYYHRTGDYTVGRFAQMMWRLNFLVAACCVVLRNDYMLYYICPMHTLFTVLVYTALGIGRQVNGASWGIALKVVASLGVVVAVWDVPGVFRAIWRPFTFMVGYLDPRRDGGDALHEWFFRSGLDRYVWIWGMVVAWLHPQIEAGWKALDDLRKPLRLGARAALVASTVAAGYVWYTRVFSLPKLEYNAIHPYTSWIPLTLWIVVRNLTPALRSHSLGLFGWLGCITLETYIGQFHIWLRSNIPNGQPKWVLDLVPGYQLGNFLICSLVYIGVSHRLFTLTNTLKDAWVPHSDNATLARNGVLMALALGGLYIAGTVVHLFVWQSL